MSMSVQHVSGLRNFGRADQTEPKDDDMMAKIKMLLETLLKMLAIVADVKVQAVRPNEAQCRPRVVRVEVRHQPVERAKLMREGVTHSDRNWVAVHAKRTSKRQERHD
jgi:hypothetical protein